MGKKICFFPKNLKLFKVKFDTKNNSNIRKNILACLFSVHNTIRLSHVMNLFMTWWTYRTNLNIQNSMVVSIFSVLGWKQLPFVEKFGPKNRNCQFKLKIGTSANLNMKNSIVMFIFCDFDRKYTFFWKFLQKSKLLKLKFWI